MTQKLHFYTCVAVTPGLWGCLILCRTFPNLSRIHCTKKIAATVTSLITFPEAILAKGIECPIHQLNSKHLRIFIFFCFILHYLKRKGNPPSYCLCVYRIVTLVVHISEVHIYLIVCILINGEEVHIFLYKYVYTFLFSKIATKIPRENYFIPQPHPQPLKTCKYFSFLHQNPAKQAKNTRMKRNMAVLSLGLRVWDNEPSSWDKHIYWACYVSNVTKVEDLKNALCGSFHTLWSHNSSLIQMQ